MFHFGLPHCHCGRYSNELNPGEVELGPSEALAIVSPAPLRTSLKGTTRVAPRERLKTGSIPPASGPATASAYLVNKLGVLLVSLGVIHFVNMSVFYVLGRPRRVTPPLAPAPGWGPSPAAPPPRPSDAGGPPATGPVRM